MRPACGVAIAALVAAGLPGFATAEVLHGLIRPVEQPPVSEQLPTGAVTLTIRGGEVIVGLTVTRLSPGRHTAHLHGFAVTEPIDAVCATADADANGDGFVDLTETRDVSGVTLVPLNDDPETLEIEAEGYPEADAFGEIEHRQTIDLEALDAALRESFGTPAALQTRVLYIQGVPEETPLPDSVGSLEGVPAHVTLPVACAVLEPA